MKVLVTGASGFVAHHLTQELAENGHEVALTSPDPCTHLIQNTQVPSKIVDLTNKHEVVSLVDEVRPDAVCHLAALSHVGDSWGDRDTLMNTNVVATFDLCQAVSQQKKPVKFLFVSTGQVYSSAEGELACSETTLPNPQTPYACSKLAAESLVQSFRSSLFKPYIARPFNHIGPGQSENFVAPAFAQRVLNAPDGGKIPVGNLASARDFCDVRDVAYAYRKILEIGPVEELFVLGGGRMVAMSAILEKLFKISGKSLETQTDATLVRGIDPGGCTADSSLAKKVLNFSITKSLDESLRDIYEYAQKTTERG